MAESTIFSLVTFLLGLLLGHRLTLGRERRKEFNEVAARIRVALKSRKSTLRPSSGSADRIDPTDRELFEHLLNSRKRTKFHRAWSDYEAECERTKSDSIGQPYYETPAAVAESLERLIAFTTLR